MRYLLWTALAVALAYAAIHTARNAIAHPENAWLRTWISASCCVTNDCCYDIQAADIRDLGNDYYQIVASGQVLKRTGWSPDGQYWRCACDSIDGKWTVFDKAFTRCLFVPQPSS